MSRELPGTPGKVRETLLNVGRRHRNLQAYQQEHQTMPAKHTIARRNPVARALRQIKAKVVRSKKTYTRKRPTSDV
jgi:hypothetical protein